MQPFSLFIKNLESALHLPLPGEEAQFVMAPYQRALRKTALFANPSPKLSAVLVLIYPLQGEPHTLLMLRNSYDGVHSGQVSFPGGGKDDIDKTLEDTALREAEEEAGIRRNNVKIIGKLTKVYIPPSKFLVQPYIGFMEERPALKPDKKEVKQLIETPLQLIVDENTIKTKTIRLGNGMLMENTPYFDIYGNTVWGATAMMLGELKEILKQVEGFVKN